MLEVKNIVKSFGRNRVLNKISFKVNKGDIVSVIGPSGSGKSTLLRCINHLEEPNSGKIIFNGEEVTKKNITKVREKIGMVFQQFNLFPNMTVLENLCLAPVLSTIYLFEGLLIFSIIALSLCIPYIKYLS